MLLRAVDPDRERLQDVTVFAEELRRTLVPEATGASGTVLRSPASLPTPRPTATPAAAGARRGPLGTGALLLVCLVVLAAAFGLSYLVVTLLR